MANIVVLGGGFAGVVAAESLVKRLGPEHEVTLISRHREFVFYPGLVNLAFGRCEVEDITNDLREALLDRRINFVQAEIAYPEPDIQKVLVTHGEVEGKIPYDYLIFALGRRLATESVPGYFDHGHHLLSVNSALRFKESLKNFKGGHAVVGYCQDSRLGVPVYETAFALDRYLIEKGLRESTTISMVSPEEPGDMLGGSDLVPTLTKALTDHGVEFISHFPVAHVTDSDLETSDGRKISYDLLMLLPPFAGPGEAQYIGIADANGYVRVDRHMKVTGAHRMYAAGDCINLLGPKMAHMAVLQGMVAAANIASELEGNEPVARYNHELMFVIDEGGQDSIYLHQALWSKDGPSIKQGRFWGWAKHIHQKYWQRIHK